MVHASLRKAMTALKEKFAATETAERLSNDDSDVQYRSAKQMRQLATVGCWLTDYACECFPLSLNRP